MDHSTFNAHGSHPKLSVQRGETLMQTYMDKIIQQHRPWLSESETTTAIRSIRGRETGSRPRGGKTRKTRWPIMRTQQRSNEGCPFVF